MAKKKPVASASIFFSCRPCRSRAAFTARAFRCLCWLATSRWSVSASCFEKASSRSFSNRLSCLVTAHRMRRYRATSATNPMSESTTPSPYFISRSLPFGRLLHWVGNSSAGGHMPLPLPRPCVVCQRLTEPGRSRCREHRAELRRSDPDTRKRRLTLSASTVSR